MSKFLMFAVVLITVLSPGLVFSAGLSEEGVPAVGAAQPTTATTATSTDEKVGAASDQFFARGSLSLRERRALGLTIPQMAGALKDLHKNGELEPDMDKSLVAAMVFERLSAENMSAYSAPELDFDSILAFIEKFLPILMMILGLFS